MPLDTGAVTHNLPRSADADVDDGSGGSDAPMDRAPSIGAALRAKRKRLGLTLEKVSDATRIKHTYLQALEEMRVEDLPSRPFAIGFVRSYAQVLGLDPEAAVARFKQDVPMEAEPLRAPVGVRKHSDIRIALLFGGSAIVVTAVLLWNLAQHAVMDQSPPPPVVPESAAQAAPASAGPSTVAISAPQPAPQESTLPTPYQTPGLDGSSAPAAAQVFDGAIDPKAAVVFSPHGAVYGASAAASNITLQAKSSVSLLIRTPDGRLLFAQELKAGEAYRAPPIEGVSAEVSDPQDVNVYVGGRIHTGLTGPVTPLAKIAPLSPPAPPPPPAPAPAAPGQAGAAQASSAPATKPAAQAAAARPAASRPAGAKANAVKVSPPAPAPGADLADPDSGD